MIVKILISLCCSIIFSQHFQVDLNPTGVNDIIIISNTVTGLDDGDEIGVFDPAGVSENCIPDLGCDTSLITYQEVLVGASVCWPPPVFVHQVKGWWLIRLPIARVRRARWCSRC